MKIKFLRDTLPREDSDDNGKPVVHKKGETLEVSDASGSRWIRRGAAEEVKSGRGAAAA